MKENQRRNLGLLILAFHLIGVAGTLYPALSTLTISLTPVNLLLSCVLIYTTHGEKSKSFYLFLLVSFLVGFFVEMAGVSTGAIFGEYHYGPTLGWSWMGVPWVIGVNWFVLSYCFAEMANRLPWPWMGKVIAAAAGMLMLDLLIEPVAVRLDYWQWAGGQIPIHNFAGWFFVALGLQVVARKLLGDFRNTFSMYLIASQIIYFCLILLFY